MTRFIGIGEFLRLIKWPPVDRDAEVRIPPPQPASQCLTHTKSVALPRYGTAAAVRPSVPGLTIIPKPFTWTADPDKIIAAVRRGHARFRARSRIARCEVRY